MNTQTVVTPEQVLQTIVTPTDVTEQTSLLMEEEQTLNGLELNVQLPTDVDGTPAEESVLLN